MHVDSMVDEEKYKNEVKGRILIDSSVEPLSESTLKLISSTAAYVRCTEIRVTSFGRMIFLHGFNIWEPGIKHKLDG